MEIGETGRYETKNVTGIHMREANFKTYINCAFDEEVGFIY